MKKLLLTPFLLASLFSFGGELKANPGSRYELPDPRNINNDPLGKQSSKYVWYLIMNNFVVIRDIGSNSTPWSKHPKMMPALKFIPTSSKLNCTNMARNLNSWLRALDLGKKNTYTTHKYRTYFKCIQTTNSSNANTYLFINSQPMRYSSYPGGHGISSNVGSVPNPLSELYFSDLSKCNMAKIKLDAWFLKIKNKMLSGDGYRSGYEAYYKVDTKCLNK